MSILQTKGLVRTYGKGENAIHAVNHVDLGFEEGEFTAVTGRSGSGKSTLLHLLGGLDVPTEGDVMLEGQSLYELDDKKRTILRRRRIGLVFQFYNLMPDLTVYQNIILPIRLDNKAIDKEYIDRIVECLGLKDRLDHYSNELSGGQRQRVAIARAMATKPAILLADEPTGNLDGKSGVEVLELLHQLRRQLNQTLIMVTHDQRIAEGADRILTVSDGRIIGDTADDVGVVR